MSNGWAIDVMFFLGAPVDDKQMDALSDKFDELDWTVAQLPDGHLSVLGVFDDEGPLDAASWVAEISKQTLLDLGIDGELDRIAVCSERWRETEARAPVIPELLAATDIGKVLGVSRQRVWQLQNDHPQFPAPVVRTGAGALWSRSAVDWFASVWDRRPGHRADEGSTREDKRPVVTALRARSGAGSGQASTRRRAARERAEA